MRKIITVLLFIFISGCVPGTSNPANDSTSALPTATTDATGELLPTKTMPPSATATPLPPTESVPTAVVPATETMPPPTELPPTAVSTSTPTSTGTLSLNEDGTVYLGTTLLLNIGEDAPGCYHDIMPEIIYSPTDMHFLLVVHCIEGDNQAFVFAADGSGRQKITEPFDYVNMLNIEWSADGQTIVYERINSCCLSPEDIPANAPPQGQVQYDIATGQKTLVTP